MMWRLVVWRSHVIPNAPSCDRIATLIGRRRLQLPHPPTRRQVSSQVLFHQRTPSVVHPNVIKCHYYRRRLVEQTILCSPFPLRSIAVTDLSRRPRSACTLASWLGTDSVHRTALPGSRLGLDSLHSAARASILHHPHQSPRTRRSPDRCASRSPAGNGVAIHTTGLIPTVDYRRRATGGRMLNSILRVEQVVVAI